MKVVVACYPEDLATEFLSVLDSAPSEPLQAILAARGTTLRLPPGAAATRLAAVACQVDVATPADGPIDRSRFASLLEACLPRSTAVWTHCPADERRDRATVGWLTALAHPGSAVLHAVGISSHYQFLSDVTIPLSADQIRLKLDFLDNNAAALVRDDLAPRHIPTEAVAACERFVRLTAAEADRMHALLHSIDDDASWSADPWDFRHSRYERERLRRTAEWVSRHITPAELLIEVGSCEGALTSQLLAAGHQVLACEPNERFRTRLMEAVRHRAGITAYSLEDLAHVHAVHAAAYLLIEMLYYVDDLSIMDNIPSDLLFLAVNSEEMRQRVDPWLAASPVWELGERVELVAPRIDFVCGDRVYRRKEGCVGALCRRIGASSA